MARRPVVVDPTCSETVDPHVEHRVCARYSVVNRHSTCEKCPIILHDGNFPRRGGLSRVLMQFNDFCKRGTNEGRFTTPIHLSYIVMPGYLGTRECRRRGCDSISECEHRGFLIAASGCLMNFFYPYFPPLYNFIANVEISSVGDL